MSIKVLFFGSSPFSVVALQTLLDHKIDIAAAVTFSDKPVGRHLTLTPNPVKSLAQKYDIHVIERISDLVNCADLYEQERRPDPGNDQGVRAPAVAQIKQGIIALVAAYGKIIKPEILNTFNNHIYNIHPSLLPKYRGPSPLQQQILDGVNETGVTIIQLDEQMDHGPIVAQEKDVLLPTDTTHTLGKRLFKTGAEVFINLITTNSLNNNKLIIQNDTQATYTSKLTRASGFIDFEKFNNYLDLGACDLVLSRMHRAFTPWPGIWTTTPENKRLKLISIDPIVIQLEGKNPQSWPLK